MALDSSEEEKYQAELKKTVGKALTQSDAWKYMEQAVRNAFKSGYLYGKKELYDSAKRLVEAQERSMVDSVLLGGRDKNGRDEPDDDIPF